MKMIKNFNLIANIIQTCILNFARDEIDPIRHLPSIIEFGIPNVQDGKGTKSAWYFTFSRIFKTPQIGGLFLDTYNIRYL